MKLLSFLAMCAFAGYAQPVSSDAQIERDARIAMEQSDKALNAAWKAATKRIQAIEREPGRDRRAASALDRMKDAQRKWLAFRDAECGIHGALTGGSVDRIDYLGCLDTLTRSRAKELNEWAAMP